MTKTLTDKWRAGNLKKSFYYLKFPDTETAEIYNLYDMEKFRYVQDSEKIDVLDEVPSYEEYNDLIQQNVNQESAIETYIERIKELEEIFDSAVDALYEYIKMYGVERECSKFLQKYGERAK